jgi:hypothetical protein
MAQGTGHIRDFTKPVEMPPEISAPIQRHSAITGVQTEVEIHVHEELVVQGQDRLRGQEKKEGDPEIRLRISDRAAWEKVKRDEDDE